MLQIQHIRKEYKTGKLVQKALDDVSLNLRDNEFVAILGPSGSGKTTLLNIIGGLDRMISVGIPVPVFVFFRGNPVDDQIPAVVTIQPADNI